MSTTNESDSAEPQSSQVAWTDLKAPDWQSGSETRRPRARDECFDVFLRYYDAASIRVLDHATTADTPDPKQVPSFSVVRELGNSTRFNLVECPIDGCHAPFHPKRSASEHFLRNHEPTDVGLSPITTPLEERTPSDDPEPVDSEWWAVDDRDVDTESDAGSREPERNEVADDQVALTEL